MFEYFENLYQSIIDFCKKQKWAIFIYKVLSFICIGIYNLFLRLFSSFKTPNYLRQVLAASMVVLSLYVFVFFVVGYSARFTYQALRINLLSNETEYVYSRSEQVQGKENEFRVYACKKSQCVAQVDTIEYRIKDNIYMDVVWLLTKGQFYDPGELAGTFMGNNNNCKVQEVGKRRKLLNSYPQLIIASCNYDSPEIPTGIQQNTN